MAIPQSALVEYARAIFIAQQFLLFPEDQTTLGLQTTLTALNRARTALLAVRGEDPAAVDIKLVEIDNLLAACGANLASGPRLYPVIGAGVTVGEAARARVPDSGIASPLPEPLLINNAGRVVPAPDNTAPTTAQIFVPAQDFGTDDELRPYLQTQATPPSAAISADDYADAANNAAGGFDTPATTSAAAISAAGVGTTVGVGTTPGVGAGVDDGGSPSNATQITIDNLFSQEQIIPQSNVLDQYASYTYNISLYLLTLNTVKNMNETGVKTIAGSQLLIQSGGAPASSTNGRNPYFVDDYYFDSLNIESVITGKGTNGSHNAAKINFTIIEPNGITLIENLGKAVDSYLGPVQGRKRNWTAENFLIVIRFYGYDNDGKIVRAGPKPDGSTDSNAFVEKFYPISIANIKFRVANKAMEYYVQAVPISYCIAGSTSRGTIPYNLEFSGGTVKDILTGNTAYEFNNQILAAGSGGTISPAPSNAGSASSVKKTISKGLVQALNDYQTERKNEGRIGKEDIYSIDFGGLAVISDATIIVSASTNDTTLATSATAMPVPRSTADALITATQCMDPKTQRKTIQAGQQMLMVIDQVVRNSSYIRSQQLYKVDNAGAVTANSRDSKNVAWFKVSMSATPYDWDEIRNDYAYRIRYTITPYVIANAPPPWFTTPQFRGVHKQYNYWFTGINTAIISYEQEYNSSALLYLSGGLNKLQLTTSANANNLQKYTSAPRSSESSQGATNDGTLEPSANLADFLYNPSDLGKANLIIIGDPAWLQQGEIFASPRKGNFNFDAFLPDGTINFDARQICFEIRYNRPRDYNYSTGIYDPQNRDNASESGFSVTNGTTQIANPQQSFVFIAARVTSDFKQGKFTQSINGTLLNVNLNRQQLDLTAQVQARSAATTTSSPGVRVSTQNNALIGPLLSTPAAPLIGAAASKIAAAVSNTVGSAVDNAINQATGRITNLFGARPAQPPEEPTSSGQPVGYSDGFGDDPPISQDTAPVPAPPPTVAANDDSGMQPAGPDPSNPDPYSGL